MIKMKDSGIEWIGAIPTSWEVSRIKELFYEINERCSNSSDYKLLSVSEYYGVAPKAECISSEDMLTHAETLDGYKICKINDIVMNIMLAWKRAMGVSKYDGIVSPAYCVYRSKKEMNSTYFHYLFRTDVYANLFKQYSTGIIDSRLRLYPDKFLALKCQVPPLETQHRIADYLDKKCAKIDEIIEKQQAVIEKLKEYKLSVITEAVTKGLNRNVEMATLNGEWGDSIPAHWKWMSLKSVTDFITCGVAATPEYTDKETGVLFLSAQNVKQGTMDYSIERYITKELHESLTKKRKPQRGDLLQVRVGASIGNVAVVDTDEEFSVYVSLTHLRCNQMIQNEFLKFCMMSPLWLQKAFSYVDFAGSQGNLNVADLRILKVPVPPTNEQIDIMNYLNNKTRRIDYNIRCREETLNKLHEYKKSLIYEVVTGKKEV